MSGLDDLGRLAGLSSDEMRAIAAEVKLNQERLAGCAGHDFTLVDASAGTALRRRYRCRHCRGRIDGNAHHWYSLGRQHAARPHSGERHANR